MEKILDELRAVPVRKLVTTEIEYECSDEKKQDEVFNAVWDIIGGDVNAFSKITYDIAPDGKKVKVSVIQHR